MSSQQLRDPFEPVQLGPVRLTNRITNYEHMATGLREGFEFVAMGRALLREPGLVNAIREDHAKTTLCTHCNRCMYTVYGRTHCVLDPDSAFGPVDGADGRTLPLLSTSNTANTASQR